MNKTIIATTIGAVLGGAGIDSKAALTSTATLAFTPGNYGIYSNAADAGASYFTIVADTNNTLLYIGMQPGTDGGLRIGAQQMPGDAYSHGGVPYDISYPTAGYTSDHGPVDMPWELFLNTGFHYIEAPITVATDNGVTKLLDFSGLRASWNGITGIDLGGGIHIEPSSGTNPDKTYNDGTGLATITCSASSCSNSSNFTLDYAAVMLIDVGGSGHYSRFDYSLHLAGVVNAVPIPAAAWLLGTGILSMAGLSYRRKKILQR